MKNSKYHAISTASVWLVVLLVCSTAHAQPKTSSEEPVHNSSLAITYGPMEANIVSGGKFWFQGGGIEESLAVSKHWTANVEVTGSHVSSLGSSPAGLDLLTFMAGPGCQLRPLPNVIVFGHALGGAAYARNAKFPTGVTGNSVYAGALALGGGFDIRLGRRFALRIAEAEWVHTMLPNAQSDAQNSLRLSTGIVWRFR